MAQYEAPPTHIKYFLSNKITCQPIILQKIKEYEVKLLLCSTQRKSVNVPCVSDPGTWENTPS